MAFDYTDDQKKVIYLRDCNILVSAAAGSGKTAVLTERIIQRICDEKHPVQIDRMLIVTFTNAAAAEMRERIGIALRKKLNSEPGNAHLRRQLTLLNNARITTIDSFCLYLLRNHFHEICLDPGFRIADEGEVKLLKEEVLTDYLEDKFDEGDPDFLDLTERYAGNGKDGDLKSFIINLYHFCQSHPFPEEFLQQCAAELLEENGGFHEGYKSFLDAYEADMLEECCKATTEAIALCRLPGGPVYYEEAFKDDLDFYHRLKEATGHEEKCALYAAHEFMAFSRKKVQDLDEEIKKRVADVRNKKTKKIIEELKKNFYYAPFSVIAEDNRNAGKGVATLLNAVTEFARRYDAKKREKNIIDFSDMEHLALRILLKKEGDAYVPGEVALGYRDYFEEIMVDEYQDSNQVQELLIESISKQTEDFGNRFMVGDVKQSIYRFRLARPEIFMDKYTAFDSKEGKNRRVNLSQNFRSRAMVLDGINAVFEEIMMPAVGKIAYDADARLYYGANYPENDADNRTEILLYNKEEFRQEHLEDIEAEAMIIAARIKELYGNFPVKDKETEENRPARYSDMVILLKAAAGVDDVLKKVLEEQGIPTYVSSGRGYFAAPEIQTILNFLAVLNNPRQDIPLLGVMHSKFGNFTEEEIAKIRLINNKSGRLFDSMTVYGEKGGDSVLKNKTVEFLAQIKYWRDKAVYITVYELLEAVLQETGYLHYCMALPGGEQRRANLLVLLQKAKAFGSSGYSGLFDFIRYIELMKEKEIDFGEANILDKNANVVQIMTIHKSKGLEFPICFVANFSKQFNAKETSAPILMDAELGMGADAFDLKLRCKRHSLRRNVIATKIKNDSRGEDLRVLYVAMTRAKEKLILVGSGSLENIKMDQISAYDVLKAKSYMDMVLPIASRRDDLFEIRTYGMEDISINKAAEHVESEMLKESLARVPGKAIWEPYQYPHTTWEGLYTKTTVTELKKAAYTEEEGSKELYEAHSEEAYVPGFIREDDVSVEGTRRGSAYHRIMELMDFTIALKEGNIEEDIRKIRENAVASHRIAATEDALVRNDKVEAFMKTDLARRMGLAQQHNCLHKEQPFMLGIGANKVKPDFPEEEIVLIQGVIDAYFEEEDGLVLMDYKTDRVEAGEELVSRYSVQLMYYAEALERLTHKKVKEKLIYSFALHEVIKVE